MKVIYPIYEHHVDEVYYPWMDNYYFRGLVTYVRRKTTNKDACKGCDLKRLNDCGMACGNSCISEIYGWQCKTVHDGDLLVSADFERVYRIVRKDGFVNAVEWKRCSAEDLDSDRTLHRLVAGKYLYRGHIISNLGYYEPDRHEVWEASPIGRWEVGAAHGFTLGECVSELKYGLGEANEQ